MPSTADRPGRVQLCRGPAGARFAKGGERAVEGEHQPAHQAASLTGRGWAIATRSERFLGRTPLVAVPRTHAGVAVREAQCAHVGDAALGTPLPLGCERLGGQRRRHAIFGAGTVDVLNELAQPVRRADAAGAPQDLG